MSSAGKAHGQLTLVDKGDVRFVEGPPGEPLLQTIDDAGLVVETCFSNKAGSALLYASNLTERFFDLSSGEAGAILQKLRTYRIRLAVVYTPGVTRFSRMFGEMVAEESRGRYFGLFETVEAAREWLSRT
jgi:hypothetical protein